MHKAKYILMLVTALALAQPIQAQAKYIPISEYGILDDPVLYSVNGKITSAKNNVIKVKSKNGNRYKIILANSEIEMWIDEEGEVRKGNKVTLLLYTGTTKTKKDDIVINIHKRN